MPTLSRTRARSPRHEAPRTSSIKVAAPGCSAHSNPLVSTDTRADQIWLSKAMAKADAAEGTLAVQGVERITIIRNGYIDRRLTMVDVDDIMVTTSGDVAFLDDRGIVLARPLR